MKFLARSSETPQETSEKVGKSDAQVYAYLFWGFGILIEGIAIGVEKSTGGRILETALAVGSGAIGSYYYGEHLRDTRPVPEAAVSAETAFPPLRLVVDNTGEGSAA